MGLSIAERVASLKAQVAGAPILVQKRTAFVPETRDGFPHKSPNDCYLQQWDQRKIPNVYCMAFYFEQLVESLGMAILPLPARAMTWEQKHEIQIAIIGEEETRGYDDIGRNDIGCSGVARETAVMGMAIVEEIVKTLGLEKEIQQKGQDVLLKIAGFAFKEISKVLNSDRIKLNIDAHYEAIANHIIEQALVA